MAMAMRSVGAWRVISSAMAGSSVRCAGEPTRKVAQQVVPSKRGAGRAGSGSGSGEGAQLRCQVAAVTAVRELVVDGDVEMHRAALRDSFEAASVSGRAECVGAEECRPALGVAMAGVEAPVDEWSRMYYGRRGGGDAYSGMAALKPADADEDVPMGEGEMAAAFEAALQGAGRNAETLCQLAMRAWRKLGDADRAEQLYMEALQLAPGDSAIQASYAQFLWQCDA